MRQFKPGDKVKVVKDATNLGDSFTPLMGKVFTIRRVRVWGDGEGVGVASIYITETLPAGFYHLLTSEVVLATPPTNIEIKDVFTI